MELAGTVTALAADRMAQEDRLLVAVRGEGDGLDAVGMTKQAIGIDRPVKMRAGFLVARREVPLLLLGVPCDGRHEQSAVVLDQVGDTRAPDPTAYATSPSTCAST